MYKKSLVGTSANVLRRPHDPPPSHTPALCGDKGPPCALVIETCLNLKADLALRCILSILYLFPISLEFYINDVDLCLTEYAILRLKIINNGSKPKLSLSGPEVSQRESSQGHLRWWCPAPPPRPLPKPPHPLPCVFCGRRMASGPLPGFSSKRALTLTGAYGTGSRWEPIEVLTPLPTQDQP